MHSLAPHGLRRRHWLVPDDGVSLPGVEGSDAQANLVGVPPWYGGVMSHPSRHVLVLASLVALACPSPPGNDEPMATTTGSSTASVEPTTTGSGPSTTANPATGSTTETSSSTTLVTSLTGEDTGTSTGGNECEDCDGACELRISPDPDADPAWAMVCGTGLDEGPVAVAAMADGSITFAMTFGIPGAGNVALTLGETFIHEGGGDVIVARLATDGALEWSQLWGGPGTIELAGAAATPDGHTVFTGKFRGISTIDGQPVGCEAPCNGGVIIALDPDGGLAWHRLFTTDGDVFDGFRFSILPPAIGPTGEVVAAGIFYVTIDFGTGEITPLIAWNSYLVAIEPDGALRFVRRLANYRQEIYGTAIADDGTIAFSGHYHHGFTLDGCSLSPSPNFNSGPVLAKLTPTGKCIWAEADSDAPLTADILGNLYGAKGTKWDADGVVQWTTLGNPACESTSALRIVATDHLQLASGGCVRALDAEGNPLWTQLFALPHLAQAAIDNDGATLLTGHFSDGLDLIGPWTSAGGRDVWLTRLLPGG